jgi:hypothetical protein
VQCRAAPPIRHEMCSHIRQHASISRPACIVWLDQEPVGRPCR